MTVSAIPAISKPFLITSGLFRLTIVVLLYRKIFERLKFRTLKNFGRFYFRTHFSLEIKIVRNILQVM